MTVTPADIAVELGRPTPVAGDPVHEQWARWIDRATRAITTRARQFGTSIDALDPDDVADVITYAVVRRTTRPVDGAESTTDQMTVDDGSVGQTRRYATGQGDIYFLDQWWRLLGLVDPYTTGWSGSVGYGARP